MTPEQKSLRGRLAAAILHSRYDSRQLTERARRAFRDKFIDEVGPHRRLPEPERMRRAEQARRAYYLRLSLASSRARSTRQERRARRRRPGDGAS